MTTFTQTRHDGTEYKIDVTIEKKRKFGSFGWLYLVRFGPNNAQYMGAEDIEKFSGEPFDGRFIPT
jgi:hypothetical protein